MVGNLAAERERGRIGAGGIALLGALVYMVIVGGTASGELAPVPRVLTAAIGAGVLIAAALRAHRYLDRLDRMVVLAVVCFAVVAVFSRFPRQSLDAVLAAVAYAAALLVARELLVKPAVRSAFIVVLIGLSVTFTIGAAAVWFPRLFEWWVITGVVPPVNMELSGGPWGHRYDVALLIAILYPAWWTGRPGRVRQVAAVAVGMIGVALIVFTGSRTMWLGVAVATLIVIGPLLVRRIAASGRPRLSWPILLVVGLVAVVVGLVGVSLIGDRLLRLESLDWRLAMWSSLAELWARSPLVGVGPGSFPWALGLTSYFDTRSWAPRHPDNAIVQMLTEGGLLGLAAVALVAVGVIWAVWRGRSAAARWVLVVFAVACIGGNPTEFAFLVVIAIGWVAYAAPREPMGAPGSGRTVPVRAGLVVAGLVLSFVYAPTLVAAFAYQQASDAVASGDLDRADGALSTATSLDARMGLYHRQHGTLAYVTGDVESAVSRLERATELNPSDDVAWRVLALASGERGDDAGAEAAQAKAIRVQRADPTNMLLAVASGRASTDLLTEAVHAWPAIVGAPGWSDVLPAGVATTDIVDAAASRWLASAPIPELVTDQGIRLAALSGRADVTERALAGGGAAAQALVSFLRCEPLSSSEIEASAASPGLSLTIAARTDPDAARALELMSGRSFAPAVSELTLNPLNENAGLSLDRWGYRRPSIEWRKAPISLPSPIAGSLRWILDPAAAVDEAELASELPEC